MFKFKFPNFFRFSNSFFLMLILALAIALMFLNPLTLLKNEHADSVTRIYFADNISDAHKQLIDQFNQKYRGTIQVIPVSLPFTKFSTNERKELLARSLRSKTDRIDVFAVDLIWVPRFARWGQPLDQYFTPPELNEIIEPALKSCYYQNQLLASPFYIDIGLMYYRRDLIRTLPDHEQIEQRLKNSITWEDFIRLGERCKVNNRPFYLFPADNYEGLICSFWETLAGQNQSMFHGDSVSLNTPQARKGLQLLVNLVNRYHLTPNVVTRFDEFQCYLYGLENDALFIRGWPGFFKHYRKEYRDSTKFDKYGIAAVPHFENGQPVSALGGWNLMLSKSSTKKAAAVKFMKFVLEQQNQQLMLDLGGYLPVIRNVYHDSSVLGRHPDLSYYYQLLARGTHRPYVVDYTKVSDVVSYYVKAAIKNQVSVTEALETATRMINANKVIIQ